MNYIGHYYLRSRCDITSGQCFQHILRLDIAYLYTVSGNKYELYPVRNLRISLLQFLNSL